MPAPRMPQIGGRGGQRAQAPNAKDKLNPRLQRAGGILEKLRALQGRLPLMPGGLRGDKGPLVKRREQAPAAPSQEGDLQSRWRQVLPLLVKGGFGGWGG